MAMVTCDISHQNALMLFAEQLKALAKHWQSIAKALAKHWHSIGIALAKPWLSYIIRRFPHANPVDHDLT